MTSRWVTAATFERTAAGATRRWVKGFICEPAAIADATDISMFGGWRAYLSRQAA